MLCPCGSKKDYAACCKPYLLGKDTPTTPEALMRSRYTAFTQNNFDYIERTMKEKALNAFDRAKTQTNLKGLTWINLTVLRADQKGDTGTVEFMATFQQNGQIGMIHEISTFRRTQGKWYYVEGVQT